MTTFVPPPVVFGPPKVKCRDGSEPEEECRQEWEDDYWRPRGENVNRHYGNRKILTYIAHLACLASIDPDDPQADQIAEMEACEAEYRRLRAEERENWRFWWRHINGGYRWFVRRNCCGTDSTDPWFDPDNMPPVLEDIVAPWDLPADVTGAADDCTALYLNIYRNTYLREEEMFLDRMAPGGAFASDATADVYADIFVERIAAAREGYITDVRANCLDGGGA